MLNNFLNSCSKREFILFIMLIIFSFILVFYLFLLPPIKKYQDNNQLLIISKNNFHRHSKILEPKHNNLNLKAKTIIKKKNNNKLIDLNKNFNDKNNFLMWLCNMENKILISKIAISKLDKNNSIYASIQGENAKIEQQVCSFENNFPLNDIFYYEGYVIISIAGNKTKINNKWYLENSKISDDIVITKITNSYIEIIKKNKLMRLTIGERF